MRRHERTLRRQAMRARVLSADLLLSVRRSEPDAGSSGRRHALRRFRLSGAKRRLANVFVDAASWRSSK